ncbi:BON domain-containing protein [Massilia glaciei]|uniref:BON domain-containing protein n=1 Tax=Massilia glaciei TaxID=1524097 RepID=A0A2U2I4W2_9BURK|nr:BON domain-containing protein [Massilia glaciei]PWF54791.1 BON domain-containing protein [Massilia glaciei]
MKPTRPLLALFVSLFIGLSACSTSPTDRRVGTVLEDTAISARVKTALAADPDVNAFDVQVETFRGTVLLSGFVDSPENAMRAVQAARQVEGVQEIKSAIVIK